MAVPEGTAKFREETSKKAATAKPSRCHLEDSNPIVRMQAFFCAATPIPDRKGDDYEAFTKPEQKHGMAKRLSTRKRGPCRIRSRLALALTLTMALAMALGCLGLPRAAQAADRPFPADPGAACLAAVAEAQARHPFPAGLLRAIALVESGRRNPITATVTPWPWTVDVDGQGHFYPDAPRAIAAVRAALAEGHHSVDVGCMQVNLQHHPTAFPNLETAFDPGANARYASDFLAILYAETGDWLRAAGLYHSATPALAAPYRAKILAALGTTAPLGIEAAAPIRLIAAFRPFGAAGPTRSQMRPPPPQTAMIQNGRVLAGVRTGRSLALYRTAPVRRRS